MLLQFLICKIDAELLKTVLQLKIIINNEQGNNNEDRKFLHSSGFHFLASHNKYNQGRFILH